MSQSLSPTTINKFQKEILGYYKKFGRQMPWRETDNPYFIYVSEVMLQQTQVSRVIDKYKEFISAFPTFEQLDKASLDIVYKVWQGLGYNRRAVSLKKAAHCIVCEYRGVLPNSFDALCALPGIGKATASSLMAFAFNLPVAFIETNIRTVFIHFFFKDKNSVTDDELLPLVQQCIYKKEPRIWYWALMDYGAMLKKNGLDKNEKSAHYVKQSKFEGSTRQLRGKILKIVSLQGRQTIKQLCDSTQESMLLVEKIVGDLEKEGFVQLANGKILIRKD